MNSEIGRKYLPHQLPSNLIGGPEDEVYFITICCLPRGVNQLAIPSIWDSIVETIQLREEKGDIAARLFLAMPDHLHGLFSFPGKRSMEGMITNIKGWLAKQHGIAWQRGFFDHRLRGWESAAEKARYIRENPVRAGLVERYDQWPFSFNR